MERLSDLINQRIDPEPGRVLDPGFRRVDTPLPIAGTASAPAAYEVEVFNYLLACKEQLGVRDVWRCRSIRIDGLLDLENGQRVGLEVKYRMNWEKACQAGHQFSWFRKHPDAAARPIDSGVVVFEQFSGHWARRKKSWLLESGWNFWYMDHQDVDGFRVDLVRLLDGTFDSLPTALTAARAEGSGS